MVHNGVIENHRALKEQPESHHQEPCWAVKSCKLVWSYGFFPQLRLSSKGYQFLSQTDTELLAHLVQDIFVSTLRHLPLPVCSNFNFQHPQDLKMQMDGASWLEALRKNGSSFRVSSTSSKQSKTIKDLVLPTKIPSFLLLWKVRFLPSLPLKESSCHLDILQVVATALRLCEGAYGVAFIFEDISKILKVQVWNLSCWLKVPQNNFF